jgi:hypothetical protein
MRHMTLALLEVLLIIHIQQTHRVLIAISNVMANINNNTAVDDVCVCVRWRVKTCYVSNLKKFLVFGHFSLTAQE